MSARAPVRQFSFGRRRRRVPRTPVRQAEKREYAAAAAAECAEPVCVQHGEQHSATAAAAAVCLQVCAAYLLLLCARARHMKRAGVQNGVTFAKLYRT